MEHHRLVGLTCAAWGARASEARTRSAAPASSRPSRSLRTLDVLGAMTSKRAYVTGAALLGALIVTPTVAAPVSRADSALATVSVRPGALWLNVPDPPQRIAER